MAKAKIETVEMFGTIELQRFFKAKAWSYQLVAADGTEIASTWSINLTADAWATKGGPGPVFRAPVIGEANAVAWIRSLGTALVAAAAK